ncbi:LppU/SCO3897 family protein [Nocardia niwae]|uniref:Lipoprotein LppU n=1 Tax=Nocardia niwae TaxID=626084 RepID=A0ABV2X6H5_9NOCA|nr:hypothetical protein [Nocardia niwae]
MRFAIPPRGAVTVALLALALATSGCGDAGTVDMKVGECGYFTRGQANRAWDVQRRSCADPEAALVVVRGASKVDCPDLPFSWSSRGSRALQVCTHLNAQVGDCFNNPGNQYAHLHRLRKVPCSTPEAYEVNTRVERADYGVCHAANSEYGQTAEIVHKQPPVSFCLHRVGS